MFNTYNNATNNTLKINAVSGGIYKTYKESWFKQFHLKSTIADVLLDRDYDYYHNKEIANKYGDVIVLQMVICGDMEIMAELIKKKDFDKYFIDESIGEMEEKDNEN